MTSYIYRFPIIKTDFTPQDTTLHVAPARPWLTRPGRKDRAFIEPWAVQRAPGRGKKGHSMTLNQNRDQARLGIKARRCVAFYYCLTRYGTLKINFHILGVEHEGWQRSTCRGRTLTWLRLKSDCSKAWTQTVTQFGPCVAIFQETEKGHSFASLIFHWVDSSRH